MELKRRQFLKIAAAAAAGLWVCAWRGLKHLPVRVVRALRPRRYPGNVAKLDQASVSGPARWLG